MLAVQTEIATVPPYKQAHMRERVRGGEGEGGRAGGRGRGGEGGRETGERGSE